MIVCYVHSNNKRKIPSAMSNTPKLISKSWFCWLGLVSGIVGVQWWYAWRSNPQKQHKLKMVLCIMAFPLGLPWGWVDVLRYGLMSDEKFNAVFNPHSDPNTHQGNGWTALFIVLAFSLLAILTLALLALFNQWWTTRSFG
jgi:hypothetical protein